MMSDESQRVVVIHHASRDFSARALKWAINGFSLEHGDSLTLVSILHHVKSPTSAKFREFLNLTSSFFLYFIFVLCTFIIS
jgi:hypothetical protein